MCDTPFHARVALKQPGLGMEAETKRVHFYLDADSEQLCVIRSLYTLLPCKYGLQRKVTNILTFTTLFPKMWVEVNGCGERR